MVLQFFSIISHYDHDQPKITSNQKKNLENHYLSLIEMNNYNEKNSHFWDLFILSTETNHTEWWLIQYNQNHPSLSVSWSVFWSGNMHVMSRWKYHPQLNRSRNQQKCRILYLSPDWFIYQAHKHWWKT